MKIDREGQMGIQISKYLDDELSQPERELLEKHLTQCASCREVVQIFRRNEELLKSALSVEVYGNEIVDKVEKRIRTGDRPSTGARVWSVVGTARFGIGAAASVVIGLLAVLVLQNMMILGRSNEVETLQKRVAYQTEQLNSAMVAMSKAEIQKHRDKAVTAFTRDNDGVILTVDGNEIRLTFTPPQGERVSVWDVFRREVGTEAWDRARHSDGRDLVERGEPGRRYEYKVVPNTDSDRKIDPYIVQGEVEKDAPSLLNVASRRDQITMEFVAWDAAQREATFTLSRKFGLTDVSATFQLKVGQTLGGTARDWTGAVRDWGTGWILNEVIPGTQTVATTSKSGVVYTRENVRAVLRPTANPRSEQKVSCWKNESATFRVLE